MKKKKLPKWVEDMKIEVKQELELKDILITALDKYTVKDLLEYMFVITTHEGLIYGMSMLSLLANKKDVEGVKSMILLKYMLDNWNKKDFLKKAGKNFREAMERAEKKAKKEKR